MPAGRHAGGLRLGTSFRRVDRHHLRAQAEGGAEAEAAPPSPEAGPESGLDQGLQSFGCTGTVAVQVGKRGRGTFATTDLVEDNVALSVPLLKCLCVQETGEAPGTTLLTHQELWQKEHAEIPEQLLRFIRAPDIPAEERLAIYLLWACQKGGSEWMGPLSDLLPKAGEDGLTVPMLWAEEEWEELQDPGMALSLKRKRMLAEESYERTFMGELGEKLREVVGVTSFDAYHWALAIVRTRGICDKFSDTETVAMIVPGIDLANHDFEFNAEGALTPDGRFNLVALKEIKAGDEVVVAYQERISSMGLMERYGFVVPSNPSDSVPLPALAPDQLREVALNPQLFMAACGGMVGAGLPKGRAEVLLKSLPLLEGEIDVKDQQARSVELLRHMDTSLKAYPTTAEEDVQQLQSEGVTAQSGTAICYRLEQKFVLRDAMAAAKGYARILPGLVAGLDEEKKKQEEEAGGAGAAGEMPPMPGAAPAAAAGDFPPMPGAPPAAGAPADFPPMPAAPPAAEKAADFPPMPAAPPASPATEKVEPPPAPATPAPAAETSAASGGDGGGDSGVFFQDVDPNEKF